MYTTFQGTDGTQAFDGMPVSGHGNLFMTQEYLGTSSSAAQWEPVSGQSFDALDRLVSKLTTEVCPAGTGDALCSPTVERQATSCYDQNGQYGLVSVVENADETALFNVSYDADGRLLNQEIGTTTGGASTASIARTLTTPMAER